MSDDEDAAPVDPRQYIQRGKVVEPRRRTGKRTNKTPNNTAEQQKSPRPLSKNRNKSLPTLKEESASAYSTIRGLYHKTGEPPSVENQAAPGPSQRVNEPDESRDDDSPFAESEDEEGGAEELPRAAAQLEKKSVTRPSDRVTPLLHEDYDDQTRSSNGEIGGRGAGVQTEDPREHDISFGSDGNKSRSSTNNNSGKLSSIVNSKEGSSINPNVTAMHSITDGEYSHDKQISPSPSPFASELSEHNNLRDSGIMPHLPSNVPVVTSYDPSANRTDRDSMQNENIRDSAIMPQLPSNVPMVNSFDTSIGRVGRDSYRTTGRESLQMSRNAVMAQNSVVGEIEEIGESQNGESMATNVSKSKEAAGSNVTLAPSKDFQTSEALLNASLISKGGRSVVSSNQVTPNLTKTSSNQAAAATSKPNMGSGSSGHEADDKFSERRNDKLSERFSSNFSVDSNRNWTPKFSIDEREPNVVGAKGTAYLAQRAQPTRDESRGRGKRKESAARQSTTFTTVMGNVEGREVSEPVSIAMIMEPDLAQDQQLAPVMSLELDKSSPVEANIVHTISPIPSSSSAIKLDDNKISLPADNSKKDDVPTKNNLNTGPSTSLGNPQHFSLQTGSSADQSLGADNLKEDSNVSKPKKLRKKGTKNYHRGSKTWTSDGSSDTPQTQHTDDSDCHLVGSDQVLGSDFSCAATNETPIEPSTANRTGDFCSPKYHDNLPAFSFATDINNDMRNIHNLDTEFSRSVEVYQEHNGMGPLHDIMNSSQFRMGVAITCAVTGAVILYCLIVRRRER